MTTHSGYERIGFNDGSRLRYVFLREINDRGAWVRGIEVDKAGDEIVPPGADRRLRIIQKGAIVSRRPYRMDPTYAELYPSGRPVLSPNGPYSRSLRPRGR